MFVMLMHSKRQLSPSHSADLSIRSSRQQCILAPREAIDPQIYIKNGNRRFAFRRCHPRLRAESGPSTSHAADQNLDDIVTFSILTLRACKEPCSLTAKLRTGRNDQWTSRQCIVQCKLTPAGSGAGGPQSGRSVSKLVL